ncbi:AlpA family transcriptional regulator [Magnetospirillum sp. UT-4]|uniref:helix-turn-helix transcriptional regulator n=1 Tax=Magnetospirillum sp. UT-4 TaxID=2681467 RepID=UPI001381A2AD|nr:helix-turn-helix domain-containing protein [Magnetospirillum sp. UT-4]CAA7613492.1 hypothetical protein MTBUT4_150016 [Magnetospirillum sp. UT-4]
MTTEGIRQVKVRVLPDGRLSRKDAAAYLGLKPQTLTKMAAAGKGPRRVRLGGKVYYYKADLDAFIAVGGDGVISVRRSAQGDVE